MSDEAKGRGSGKLLEVLLLVVLWRSLGLGAMRLLLVLRALGAAHVLPRSSHPRSMAAVVVVLLVTAAAAAAVATKRVEARLSLRREWSERVSQWEETRRVEMVPEGTWKGLCG